MSKRKKFFTGNSSQILVNSLEDDDIFEEPKTPPRPVEKPPQPKTVNRTMEQNRSFAIKKTNRAYTHHEDQEIVKYVLKEDNSYLEAINLNFWMIAEKQIGLSGRSGSSLHERYKKLIQTLHHFGVPPKKVEAITKYSRGSASVRKKIREKILGPLEGKNRQKRFTYREDRELLKFVERNQMHSKNQLFWTEAEKLFPGRTAHSLWRRYRRIKPITHNANSTSIMSSSDDNISDDNDDGEFIVPHKKKRTRQASVSSDTSVRYIYISPRTSPRKQSKGKSVQARSPRNNSRKDTNAESRDRAPKRTRSASGSSDESTRLEIDECPQGSQRTSPRKENTAVQGRSLRSSSRKENEDQSEQGRVPNRRRSVSGSSEDSVSTDIDGRPQGSQRTSPRKKNTAVQGRSLKSSSRKENEDQSEQGRVPDRRRSVSGSSEDSVSTEIDERPEGSRRTSPKENTAKIVEGRSLRSSARKESKVQSAKGRVPNRRRSVSCSDDSTSTEIDECPEGSRRTSLRKAKIVEGRSLRSSARKEIKVQSTQGRVPNRRRTVSGSSVDSVSTEIDESPQSSQRTRPRKENTTVSVQGRSPRSSFKKDNKDQSAQGRVPNRRRSVSDSSYESLRLQIDESVVGGSARTTPRKVTKSAHGRDSSEDSVRLEIDEPGRNPGASPRKGNPCGSVPGRSLRTNLRKENKTELLHGRIPRTSPRKENIAPDDPNSDPEECDEMINSSPDLFNIATGTNNLKNANDNVITPAFHSQALRLSSIFTSLHRGTTQNATQKTQEAVPHGKERSRTDVNSGSVTSMKISPDKNGRNPASPNKHGANRMLNSTVIEAASCVDPLEQSLSTLFGIEISPLERNDRLDPGHVTSEPGHVTSDHISLPRVSPIDKLSLQPRIMLTRCDSTTRSGSSSRIRNVRNETNPENEKERERRARLSSEVEAELVGNDNIRNPRKNVRPSRKRKVKSTNKNKAETGQPPEDSQDSSNSSLRLRTDATPTRQSSTDTSPIRQSPTSLPQGTKATSTSLRESSKTTPIKQSSADASQKKNDTTPVRQSPIDTSQRQTTETTPTRQSPTNASPPKRTETTPTRQSPTNASPPKRIETTPDVTSLRQTTETTPTRQSPTNASPRKRTETTPIRQSPTGTSLRRRIRTTPTITSQRQTNKTTALNHEKDRIGGVVPESEEVMESPTREKLYFISQKKLNIVNHPTDDTSEESSEEVIDLCGDEPVIRRSREHRRKRRPRELEEEEKSTQLSQPIGEEIDLSDQPIGEEIDLSDQPIGEEIDLSQPIGEEIDISDQPIGEEIDLSDQPIGEEIELSDCSPIPVVESALTSQKAQETGKETAAQADEDNQIQGSALSALNSEELFTCRSHDGSQISTVSSSSSTFQSARSAPATSSSKSCDQCVQTEWQLDCDKEYARPSATSGVEFTLSEHGVIALGDHRELQSYQSSNPLLRTFLDTCSDIWKKVADDGRNSGSESGASQFEVKLAVVTSLSSGLLNEFNGDK